MNTVLHLTVPPDFAFTATVCSHGWYQLAPFHYDEQNQCLSRLEGLADGTLVALLMRVLGDQLVIEVDQALSDFQAQTVGDRVRKMLSLDWHMHAFYDAIRPYPQYHWVETQKQGRLLVAPTVWEDLAKTLLTTNTTWAQTRHMVARLCSLGTPYANGHVFPSALTIAQLDSDVFAMHIRAGYRADYLHTLARQIADGLDVEAWGSLSSEELYRQVRALKGFGDYATSTMLRLLGHFDRIAIDTECRSAYKRVTNSASATDKDIRAYYDAFGQWKGMVMWMDIIG